jgi:Fe-S-cluster containining protein
MNRRQRRAVKAAPPKQKPVPSTRTTRRVSLLAFQEQFDQLAAEAEQRHVVSCRRGCHGCCKQLVVCSDAEAERIVDEYPEAVAKVRGELANQRRRMNGLLSEEGGTLSKLASRWWQEQVDCAFLVGGECSIYTARPLCCRNYYVLSDPALCDRVETTRVMIMHPIPPVVAEKALAAMQPDGRLRMALLPDAILAVQAESR